MTLPPAQVEIIISSVNHPNSCRPAEFQTMSAQSQSITRNCIHKNQYTINTNQYKIHQHQYTKSVQYKIITHASPAFCSQKTPTSLERHRWERIQSSRPCPQHCQAQAGRSPPFSLQPNRCLYKTAGSNPVFQTPKLIKGPSPPIL